MLNLVKESMFLISDGIIFHILDPTYVTDQFQHKQCALGVEQVAMDVSDYNG